MIKRVFTIKDENYSDEFELSGKGGIIPDWNDWIWILDTEEIAIEAVESVGKYNEEREICEIDDEVLTKHIETRIKIFKDILVHETLTRAREYINDDEEMEMITWQ